MCGRQDARVKYKSLVVSASMEQECKHLLVIYKPLKASLRRFLNGLSDRIGVSHSLVKMAWRTLDLYQDFIWEIENEFYAYKHRNHILTKTPSVFREVKDDDNKRWKELWEDEKTVRKKNYEFNQKELTFVQHLRNEVYHKSKEFETPTFYRNQPKALLKFTKHFDKLMERFNKHQHNSFYKAIGFYTLEIELHGFE